MLILLYPREEQIHLPLIRRPEYNGVHSGQIGLPGGGKEVEDPDPVATALREAQEEIGVDPAAVAVLGTLTPLYIWASHFQVQPVVGWTPRRPHFRLDPQEVAGLLEISLQELRDPSNREEEDWELRGRRVRVPFFRLQGQVVWGATAMILSELLALLEETLAPH